MFCCTYELHPACLQGLELTGAVKEIRKDKHGHTEKLVSDDQDFLMTKPQHQEDQYVYDMQLKREAESYNAAK